MSSCIRPTIGVAFLFAGLASCAPEREVSPPPPPPVPPPSTGCEGEDPCAIRISVSGDRIRYFDGRSTSPTRRIQVAPGQEVAWSVENQADALFTVQFVPDRTPFAGGRASFGRGAGLARAAQVRAQGIAHGSAFKFAVAVLRIADADSVILVDDPELIVDPYN